MLISIIYIYTSGLPPSLLEWAQQGAQYKHEKISSGSVLSQLGVWFLNVYQLTFPPFFFCLRIAKLQSFLCPTQVSEPRNLSWCICACFCQGCLWQLILSTFILLLVLVACGPTCVGRPHKFPLLVSCCFFTFCHSFAWSGGLAVGGSTTYSNLLHVALFFLI